MSGPNELGTYTRRLVADVSAELDRRLAALGEIRDREATWADYLMAQAYEALGQADAANVRTVLIELAATALEWARDIDLTEAGHGTHEIVCSEPARATPPPDLAWPVPVRPGGPVHGGFRVVDGGNYDQP
jgi:hypothetical protein